MGAKAPKGEWAANWPLVLSCAVGVSGPSVALFALGQFMTPLANEFGWSRTEVSIGFSISLVLGVFSSPFIGRLTDLMNARTLALIGCVLGGLATAVLSLTTGDTNVWIALWMLKALATMLIGPVIWLSVLPAVFKRHRSLATALALSGQSLAATFAPALSRYLISAYGWRLAFDLLALIWYGSMLALALFFFFDRRERAPRKPPAAAGAGEAKPKDASVWAVFRSPTFLKLAFVIFVAKTMTLGDMVHLSPALTDRGFGPIEAAKIVGIAGVASMIGKVCVGWLFDRLSIFKVSAVIMAVFALACVLLGLLHLQVWWALAACAAIGATDGGLLTAIACFSGRLFRPQDFGVVFGAMNSAMAISTGLGPTLAGLAFDRFGSYAPMYWAGLVVAAVCLVLMKTVDAPPLGRAGPLAVAAE